MIFSDRVAVAVVAGIDLGTNTVRLLVARFGDKSPFEELYSEQRITRLGQDLRRTGCLVPEAIERTVAAIGDFKAMADRFQVDCMAVVATSAVRDARNRAEFIDRVKQRTGYEVQVIDGDKEAFLSYQGIRMTLDGYSDNLMIVDIGGGSTEYVSVNDGRISGAVSINMGVVHFTDGYLRSDPPADGEIAAVRHEVRQLLAKNAQHMNTIEATRFVGTAGTVTTLAAIHQGLTVYDPSKINNYTISREEIGRIFDFLRALPIKERSKVPGLAPGREDLIIAGSIILMESMDHFASGHLVVSDYGLREGLVLDLYQNLAARKEDSSGETKAGHG